MNKLFTKIGTAIVGMAMAVGVGVAVGRNSVQEAKAGETIYELKSSSSLPTGWSTNESGGGTSYLKLKNNEYATFDSFVPDGYVLNSTVTVNVSAGTFGGNNPFNIKVELLPSTGEAIASYTTTTPVSDNNEKTYRLGEDGQVLDAGTSKENVKKFRVTVVDLSGASNVARVKYVKLSYTVVSTSSDYVATITPENANLTLNAGTIITKDVIGKVTSTGSAPSDDYTEYTAELGTYQESTFTKLYNVNFGTSYVSYNGTYNAIKLIASDYPTVAQGSEYASAIINLSINDVASESFDLALSTASTTPITARTVMAGAVDTLKTINFTKGTNPGIDWTSSNESVATVDDDGVVTTLSDGETTITATSKVNNKNGVKTTASVVYTVTPAPAYTLFFNGTNKGFGNVAAAAVEEVTTSYYTNTFGNLEWTLKTVSTASANVRLMEASSSNNFIQVGTTDNPATEFSLRSSVFGGEKVKVTGVKVTAFGAAAGSAATISVTADEGSFTCNSEATAALSGNTSTEYAFVSEGAYGHISVNFASVTKGIKVASIIIDAVADSSNKAKAYAFAAKVETENSCSDEGKAELITEYKGLDSGVKAIADAITIYDKPSTDVTYKSRSYTVLEKMNYIIETYDSNSNSSAAFRSISQVGSTAIIYVIIAAVGVAIIGGLFYLNKRKEN